MKEQRIPPLGNLTATRMIAPPRRTALKTEWGGKWRRAVFMLAGLCGLSAGVVAQPLPIMPPADYNQGGLYPAGAVNTITYYSSVYGSNEQVMVYTPPGYDKSQKYGVVYAYQGIGAGIDTIFDDWCVYGNVVADNLIGQGKIRPVIIVAVNDQINGSPSADTINCVIPYMDANYATIPDADHRGVYGYSWGGMYCADVGSANLSTFHHLSPSSPAFFSSGQGPGLFPNGGAQAKPVLKSLLLSCGTADWDGFYPASQDLHEYCVSNNIPHGWLPVLGEGHDAGVWSPAMWNFLQMADAAGISTPPCPGSAYARVAAVNFGSQGGGGVVPETCSEGGQDVGTIQNGAWLVYRNVDFGGGAIGFQARVASANSGGTIKLRLDGTNGTLVGTCTVPGTGGWQTWATQSCPIRGATGKHDVYLVFTGGSGYLFNVEWWQFNFTAGQDVGAVGVAGGNSYSSGVFTVSGAGAGIGGTADAFQFVPVTNSGAGSIIARVSSAPNANPGSQAGVMIRDGTNANAANAFIGLTAGGGLTWQYRASDGGGTSTTNTAGPGAPYWVQLAWSGSVVTGSSSPDGTNWTAAGTATLTLPGTVWVGLAVSSGTNTSLGTATFDNVTGPGLPIALPPAAPGGLRATAGVEQVALNWTAAGNATSYNVKRATISGGPYAAIATVVGTNYTDAGEMGGTNDTPGSVIAGTNYYYVVSALNLGGESANSGQASVSPTDLVPGPWMTRDVGAVGLAGGASFTNGVFTVTGSGAEIGAAADAFRFVQLAATNDCTLIAEVTSASVEDIDPGSEAGVMIRDSLDNPGAASAFIAVTPGNGVVWQYRASDGGKTVAHTNNASGLSAPYWVKLVRSGNTFTGYSSPNGTTWTQQGSATIPMSSTAQAGLAVTGNDAWTQSTATFAHVTGPGWAPPLPPAPTLVGATGGIEQVALKWAASANATSYNVKEATTSGGPYTIVTNLTTTNFRATDVIGDTTYYYVVSAVSSLAGESANSAQVSAVATVNVPLPWMTQDTGAVGLWGSAGCTNGVFTVAGCGADIWNAADAFRFVYVTTRSGTYSIIARVASLQDTDPWSKAGVMIRDSVNSNAANVFLAVTPGNGITWQVRTTDGNSTTNYAVGGVSAPRWVKLACSGNKFTGSYSANGTTWTTLGTTIVSNVTTAYVGLAVASHNDSSLCTATFDNVTAPGWAMPTVPTGLAAVSASLSQINLGWNVSAVAASYTISRSTTSGGTYTVLATGVTTTNYTDTNLTSGTTYYYEVAAVNPAGASANSAPAPATTLSQPRIAGISLVGGSLVFSGTNGSVGGAYTIWSSTNLAAPLTNWLPVGGGNFDGHGNFNATNALNPSQPQQFYLLRQP